MKIKSISKTELFATNGFLAVPYRDTATLTCGEIMLPLQPATFEYTFKYKPIIPFEVQLPKFSVLATEWQDQRQLEDLIVKIAAEKPPKILNYEVTDPLIWIVISLILFLIIVFAIIIYCNRRCLEHVCCCSCRRAAERRARHEEILAINLTKGITAEQPVIERSQEPVQTNLLQNKEEQPPLYPALEVAAAIKTQSVYEPRRRGLDF
jgi:hypothetical protein